MWLELASVGSQGKFEMLLLFGFSYQICMASSANIYSTMEVHLLLVTIAGERSRRLETSNLVEDMIDNIASAATCPKHFLFNLALTEDTPDTLAAANRMKSQPSLPSEGTSISKEMRTARSSVLESRRH